MENANQLTGLCIPQQVGGVEADMDALGELQMVEVWVGIKWKSRY
jgi:hypothetical protein